MSSDHSGAAAAVTFTNSDFADDCRAIVKFLQQRPDTRAFLNPFDWKAEGRFDYPQVIQHPMDLVTVALKLENGKYATHIDFAQDVRLIWSNAMTYHRPDSDLYQKAEYLAKLFEKKIAKLDAALIKLMNRGAPPPADATSSSTVSPQIERKPLPIIPLATGPSNQKQPVPLIERLYRDVFYTILSFLDLRDFARTCLVSQNWSKIGRTMKCRHDSFYFEVGRPMRRGNPSTLRSFRPLFLLVESPLRAHITHLEIRFPSLDVNGLYLLRDRMSHLESLVLDIDLQKSEEIINWLAFFTVPHHLRELKINFWCWYACCLTDYSFGEYVSECLKQIALQATRLVKFSLYFGADGKMVCPQELQTLADLRELMLPGAFRLESQVDLVKALPSIRCWYSSTDRTFTPKSIQRLVDGANGSPPLEDLGLFSDEVDEPMAMQLRRLSSLTKLHLQRMSLPDPTLLLPFFPRLTTLQLNCREGVHPDRLAQALSACTALTSLNLAHPTFTGHHLSQCLPHQIELVDLTLYNSPGVVSLNFLTAAKNSLSQLRSLEFWSDTIPLEEYQHLESIATSLESLIIQGTSQFNLVDHHRLSGVHANQLSAALSTCVRLTSLCLTHPTLTSDDLSHCLPHLVSLTRLKLWHCQSLVTLEFLTHAAKTLTHLRHFGVSESENQSPIPTKEYEHLHAISSRLESLSIRKESFDGVSWDLMDTMTPGSPQFRSDLWSRLKSFECNRP